MSRFMRPLDDVKDFVDKVEEKGRIFSLEMMFEDFHDFEHLKIYYLGGEENVQ